MIINQSRANRKISILEVNLEIQFIKIIMTMYERMINFKQTRILTIIFSKIIKKIINFQIKHQIQNHTIDNTYLVSNTHSSTQNSTKYNNRIIMGDIK